MHGELATLVDEVLGYGLGLRERLERGERPKLSLEQAELKKRLRSEGEARRLEEATGGGSVGTTSQHGYLGARYALVCWLDEVFILDSPYGEQWRENSLEFELYREVLRAERFWDQAERAMARPGSASLEVFYLCMMLGFRGKLRGKPEELQGWRNRFEDRITPDLEAPFPLPPERQPPSNVPILTGRDRFRKAMQVVLLFLAPLVLVAGFIIVHRLSNK